MSNVVRKCMDVFIYHVMMCLLDVAELHSTLEAVRQRHRQRPWLRSRSHVCQSHLC